MPPCHSDTLERLLQALHKITEYCEDSIGIDGQLVKQNKTKQNKTKNLGKGSKNFSSGYV
jgi:hypothetical protein